METKIYAKLLEAQKEIGAIKKDSDNPYFKSKYVDINGILAVVKPILNKHGLVLTQALNVTEGRTGLNTAIVDSESGEKVESNVFLPEMSKPQETGSAITYFRRYALQSLLALESEDDDGNIASGKKVETKVTKPENPHVDEFMKDIDLSENDLIKYDEKLESAKDLKELKSIWTSLPPLAQDKLKDKKEELKFKLS